MSQNPYEQPPMMTPVSPPAPPPMAGEVQMPPGDPSKWPTVVGVICIVFGSCGVLAGCCGTGFVLFAEQFANWLEKQVAQAPSAPASSRDGIIQMRVMAQHLGLSVSVAAAGLLLASVLLCGGIGLVKRRRYSRAVLNAWSLLKVLLAIGAGALNYWIAKLAVAEGATTGPSALTIGLGFAWTILLPCFILLWMNRARVKAEVASWS